MTKKRERAKPRKVGQCKSETVAALPLACSDERAAVEFLEAQRWGESPCCPRCGSVDVKQMRDKEGNRNKRWLWRCADCQKLGDNAQYTVRVGTVMEDSPIPLRQWCHAFWRACSSKKGVSAKQIEREVGVSNKTALYMMHRIRWAMAAPEGQNDGGPLTGTVEADECYIGGKTRYKGQHPTGRPSPDRKAPVLAMVERGGHVRVRHVADVSSATLKEAVLEHVSTSARFMTDEYASYRRVNREFEGGHHTVSHKTGEYARGDVSSNTVESFFAILKRGVNGTFHSISREHPE